MGDMTEVSGAVAGLEPRGRVLVVDDERAMRELMTSLLNDEFAVRAADGVGSGLDLFRGGRFDVVLLDVMLGDGSGVEVLKRIKRMDPHAEVIMITVVKDVPTVVEAMRHGAFDFVSKRFDYDELKTLVRRAMERRRLVRENLSLRDEARENFRDDYIRGAGKAMQDVERLARRVAKTASSVIIHGESGTGKELLARRIHALGASDGAYRPFIAVNLAGIPETLVEATLFGHEKGSFTGAVRTHRGKFELADGGTLFLDEVGELKSELQAKLLRALQEREIERVGGERPIPVSVRVIAATHRDLKQMAADGRFREDLYYRLNVIPVTLPPLRDRLEDLPELARIFTERSCRRLGLPPAVINPDVMECFCGYSWPGNIRELENVVERAVALGDGRTIRVEDTPVEMRLIDGSAGNGACYEAVLRRAREEFERRFILNALRKNAFNNHRTAAHLGIHRKSLEYKIKRLGMRDTVQGWRELRRAQAA